MKKAFSRKSWIIAALRRASYRYPPRYNTMKAAWRERGKYECAQCHNIVGPKQIQIDHIIPVVPLAGFTEWGTYVDNMFCEPEGYQALCKECHKTKTMAENEKRREIKRLTSPPKPAKIKKEKKAKKV